jgi:N-acylneuraminate cytidylyltransferase
MPAKEKHIVAIIPARGGSKRIPSKNIALLAGRPMIAYTIEHAVAAVSVDRVIVSTEDLEIARVSEESGAEVFARPAEIAGDHATSESALLHVLDEIERRGERMPDYVVFLQCTSPVRRWDDIDRAIQKMEEGFDSVFSATPNFGLIWSKGKDGVQSLTYDYTTRKREQDMDKQYRENGSIYVSTPEILQTKNNRLGGKIGLYEMDMWSSFQVDTPDDIELVEFILKKKINT